MSKNIFDFFLVLWQPVYDHTIFHSKIVSHNAEICFQDKWTKLNEIIEKINMVVPLFHRVNSALDTKIDCVTNCSWTIFNVNFLFETGIW